MTSLAVETFGPLHLYEPANDNTPSPKVIALSGPAGSGKSTAATPEPTQKGRVVSQERLTYLLDYDPETGVFVWKHPTSSRVRAGRVAGNVDKMGYIQMSLDNRDYRGHRLAWLYVYGEYPDEEIDHINMVRSDNRIGNLRKATRHENARNRKAYRPNTTGFKGVIKSAGRTKFSARITVDYKPIHLGQFDTPEEANAAYEAAAIKYFGEFARAA